MKTIEEIFEPYIATDHPSIGRVINVDQAIALTEVVVDQFKPRWISAGDWLPELDPDHWRTELPLLVIVDGFESSAYYTNSGWIFSGYSISAASDDFDRTPENITHWLLLPYKTSMPTL